MARTLNQKKMQQQFLRGWIKGVLIGVGLGIVPGLFTYGMALVFPYLGAYIGNLESSTMLLWLGVVIGGAAGAVIATIVVAVHLIIDAILQAEEGAIEDAANIPLPGRR